MLKLRLRSKFLLSLVAVAAALTVTTLIVVRRTVKAQIREQIVQDLQNSVATFENVERQRTLNLTRSARLLADLPIVRALMTTQHAATIQDSSQNLSQLGSTDLFVLADQNGSVMALHTTSTEFTREAAQRALARSGPPSSSTEWWYGGNHLYEVSIQPIYFGEQDRGELLGVIAVGFEIDDHVARELSQVAASQVAFYYDDNLVRSTLSRFQEGSLPPHDRRLNASSALQPQELQLGGERFLVTTVELGTGSPSVRLSVLKSLDQSSLFLQNLNRLLMLMGIIAALAGSVMVYLISHTFTRPLQNLVGGVRALARGDYNYPLKACGGDEVAELTHTFDRMRVSLQQTQRDLLDAERLATIGRMASSISHDLRHDLSAILANAEFLSDECRSGPEREELYQELRFAVHQMNDLIESLLEFSRTRESLRLGPGSLEDAILGAIQNVRMHPEFNSIPIDVIAQSSSEGQFDLKKMERVFQNLLLNACEALPAEQGKIEVQVKADDDYFEVEIADNGHGIPPALRDRIFEPFFSHGKENGTGFGLTVAQKIVQDHGGDLRLERSSSEGTKFVVRLPAVSANQRATVESLQRS
jgi:signal transduction histidine kinase